MQLNLLPTIQEAISGLLMTYEPEFLRFGHRLFLSFATIIIAWHGIEMMFSRDGLGDSMFEFAKVLLVVSFGYALIAFPSSAQRPARRSPIRSVVNPLVLTRGPQPAAQMRYSSMEETEPDWAEYARLQKALDSKANVDNHAWGLEAGMNRPLDQKISTSQQTVRGGRVEGRRGGVQEGPSVTVPFG